MVQRRDPQTALVPDKYARMSVSSFEMSVTKENKPEKHIEIGNMVDLASVK